jgi:5-enolpyruvylshikimate-3-phosphate synthase
MAFAVLGTVYRSDVRLDSRRAVSVSYPAFFRDLARVLG